MEFLEQSCCVIAILNLIVTIIRHVGFLSSFPVIWWPTLIQSIGELLTSMMLCLDLHHQGFRSPWKYISPHLNVLVLGTKPKHCCSSDKQQNASTEEEEMKETTIEQGPTQEGKEMKETTIEQGLTQEGEEEGDLSSEEERKVLDYSLGYLAFFQSPVCFIVQGMALVNGNDFEWIKVSENSYGNPMYLPISSKVVMAMSWLLIALRCVKASLPDSSSTVGGKKRLLKWLAFYSASVTLVLSSWVLWGPFVIRNRMIWVFASLIIIRPYVVTHYSQTKRNRLIPFLSGTVSILIPCGGVIRIRRSKDNENRARVAIGQGITSALLLVAINVWAFFSMKTAVYDKNTIIRREQLDVLVTGNISLGVLSFVAAFLLLLGHRDKYSSTFLQNIFWLPKKMEKLVSKMAPYVQVVIIGVPLCIPFLRLAVPAQTEACTLPLQSFCETKNITVHSCNLTTTTAVLIPCLSHPAIEKFADQSHAELITCVQIGDKTLPLVFDKAPATWVDINCDEILWLRPGQEELAAYYKAESQRQLNHEPCPDTDKNSPLKATYENFFIMGRTDDGRLSAEIVDVHGKTCPGLPFPHHYHSQLNAVGAFVDNSLVLCGGIPFDADELAMQEIDKATLQYCLRYSHVFNRWVEWFRMLDARESAASVVIEGKYWLISGGRDIRGKKLNTMEFYDADRKSFARFHIKMPEAMDNHNMFLTWKDSEPYVAFVGNGKVFVMKWQGNASYFEPSLTNHISERLGSAKQRIGLVLDESHDSRICISGANDTMWITNPFQPKETFAAPLPTGFKNTVDLVQLSDRMLLWGPYRCASDDWCVFELATHTPTSKAREQYPYLRAYKYKIKLAKYKKNVISFQVPSEYLKCD